MGIARHDILFLIIFSPSSFLRLQLQARHC